MEPDIYLSDYIIYHYINLSDYIIIISKPFKNALFGNLVNNFSFSDLLSMLWYTYSLGILGNNATKSNEAIICVDGMFKFFL